MKKIFLPFLIFIISLTSAFTFGACNGNGDNGKADYKRYTVALNQYDIELNVGETFGLETKKYNEKGKNEDISKIEYSVEADEVASVDENGVITAKQSGSTYINVEADGIEVACFITVRSGEQLNGLVIVFTGQLYKGLSLQAYAYIYEYGVRVGSPEQISFSGSDEEKATVTESGLVTGRNVCDDLVISASCEYNGKSYSAYKTVSVVPPYYYVLSCPSVKLATTKTLSGADNSSFTQKGGITVSKVNVLDGSDSVVVNDVAVETNDERIATVLANANGEVSVTAKDVDGVATARVTVPETGIAVVVKIEVYNAVSTVADMDVLGYASLLNTELLAKNYALVNDIDYADSVILPIASYKLTSTSSAKRVTGDQWRYYLNKTADGYAPVARANIGKFGQGLSNEEFTAFSNKGINPTNAGFKGVFDGNGFSIKNAKIFFGSVLLVEGDLAVPEFASIFGRLTGTLKNVSFENISIQDPAQMIAKGYKFCADGKTLRVKNGIYQYRGTSIVGSGSACEITNVYANINYNHLYISNYSKAVLAVEMLNTCKVSNCVIESGGQTDFGYAINSSLSNANGESIKNCLAIGVNRFSKNVTEASQCGVDGNYFLGVGKTWRDLAVKTDADGLTAENAVAITFDTGKWNIAKFNSATGGRPELIKGCSLA